MNSAEKFIWDNAVPLIEAHGCELWDVEYIKEAGRRYLRVYIDKKEGVSIADCEAVSGDIGKMLDEADPVPDSYIFEVSSAGAERELKRPSDFERFFGFTVEIKLYRAEDGQKSYIGKLTGYADGDVTIDTGGIPLVFKKADIALARLRAV